MRLINCKSLALEEFVQDQAPAYAILSHRWGDYEITFEHLNKGHPLSKATAAYFKFERCCKQALSDGLEYAWNDTCCIDKSSSAELSEAINSMFGWYKTARLCYAYLDDVPKGDINEASSACQEAFRRSAWFTRGWTLQELLAPQQVRFYSQDWTLIGQKKTSLRLIQSITGIDESFLQGANLSIASIAERMSWASRRTVTRKEDTAYSLLGIFGINMPLLYGEGAEKAFLRLQEELIKSNSDESLFAWHTPEEEWHDEYGPQYLRNRAAMGLLATSPAFFEKCADITEARFGGFPSFFMANGMIQMKLTVEKAANSTNGSVLLAFLQCRKRSHLNHALAIPLALKDGVYYRVMAQPRLVKINFWRRSFVRTMNVLASPRGASTSSRDAGAPFIIRSLPEGYRVVAIHPPTMAGSDLRLHIIATGLTWENLWKGLYDGELVHRTVVLKSEPNEAGRSSFLCLELEVHPIISSWSRTHRFEFKGRITELYHEAELAQAVPIMYLREIQQRQEQRIGLDDYTVNINIEELICGNAMVVDVVNASSVRHAGSAVPASRIGNARSRSFALFWLGAMLVTLSMYVEYYRLQLRVAGPKYDCKIKLFWPVLDLLVWTRWTPITSFTIWGLFIFRVLSTRYGSLSTGLSWSKIVEYVRRSEIGLVPIILTMSASSLAIYLNIPPLWSQWPIQMGILLVLLLVVDIPAIMISRSGGYWRH